LLAIAAVIATAAAPANGGVSVRKVCAADMKTYCHGMNPLGSGLGKCMKAHWDELSEDCRAAIREREEKRHPPPDRLDE
jgi:hypothetical protein